MKKIPNRFDDIAAGDRVIYTLARWTTNPAWKGEAEVIGLPGHGRIIVRTLASPYTECTVELTDVTFACHKEGAPFTQFAGGKEQGYAEGFKTGWNWPRYRWKHDPGGPDACRARNHDNPCRHLQAYARATRDHANEWHRGFRDGEKARKERRNLPIDWNLPLELDTGEPVAFVQACSSDLFMTVRMLEDQKWDYKMRKGTELVVRRKGGLVISNHHHYVRNTYMPISKRTAFIVFPSSSRVYETLPEASEIYHNEPDRLNRMIIQIEQQADREGDAFRTVSVTGPVDPLPKRETRYTKVSKGGNQLPPSLSPRSGDNLRVVFEDDRLISAEVI